MINLSQMLRDGYKVLEKKVKEFGLQGIILVQLLGISIILCMFALYSLSLAVHKKDLYSSSPCFKRETSIKEQLTAQLLKYAGIIPSPVPKQKKTAVAGILWEGEEFTATAYDLSYECCGKYPSHPEYGITASGVLARYGRTIAVDPLVIPLGSRVYVQFPESYKKLDGWYIAEDTGEKIQGKKIDVFFGEDAFEEALNFGVQKVLVFFEGG